MSSRPKIAIIGSGCAGLGAAWALKSTDYDVHIFEKSSRLGGHTNTQIWRTAGGEEVPVDTGFIVMNTATYPNFIRFLKEVGVETAPTEMTFGVSRDLGAFEWSGEAQGIFAQKRNLLRPRHWRMIFDIIRFNQFALDLLASDEEGGMQRLGSSLSHRKDVGDVSIGEYLAKEGYSDAFRDDYLIPMTAAVWSTSPDKASLEFPARTLVRFMWNHHLLSTLAVRPPWLTIPGGSQKYIDAIIKRFPKDRLYLHQSSEVVNVSRPPPGVEHDDVTLSWINNTSGQVEGDSFAHVIFACHGDEILPILSNESNGATQPIQRTPKNGSISKTINGRKQSGSPSSVSEEERKILSNFQTTENICYLHSDLSLMPRRRACWTAWNYLTSSQHKSHALGSQVSLTYCMNILQHISLSTVGPVLVTMNPPFAPTPSLTQGKYIYRHPLYTVEAVAAQKQLEKIQNTRGVSFCGAWTNYGFHEDGFSSGLKVATQHLGAKLPFEFVDSTFSRGHKPDLGWKDYLLRVVLLLLLLAIRTIEFVVRLPMVAPLVEHAENAGSLFLDRIERLGLIKDSN